MNRQWWVWFNSSLPSTSVVSCMTTKRPSSSSSSIWMDGSTNQNRPRRYLIYTLLLVWISSTIWYSTQITIVSFSEDDLSLVRFTSLSSSTSSSVSTSSSSATSSSSSSSAAAVKSMTKNIQIPPIFIFTHHVNLLQTDFNVNAPYTTTTTTTITTVTTTTVNDSNVEQTNRKQHLNLQERYTKEELQELRVLQENIFRIIALHNNNNNNNNNTTLVRFLTDQDCLHSIRQWAYISAQRNPARLLSLLTHPPPSSFNHNTTIRTHDGSSIHPQHPTGNGNSNTSGTRQQNAVNDDAADAIANELISYFQNERTGMYKADLCRGVALYETGGIYMDIDLGIRMNLYDVLLDTSEFVTVKVHTQSHYPGAFFQAFIAAVPYHDVIQRYIELFLLYYRRIVIIEKGPIGVILLKRAYDEIQYEQEQQLLQLQQKEGTMISVSTTTHLQQTTELWQEVLYLPQYHETIFRHVPIPTWGNNKRACKFVVVIPPTHQRRQGHKTTTDDDDDNKNNSKNSATNTSNVKLIVPMYSRIAGSRMCPKIT